MAARKFNAEVVKYPKLWFAVMAAIFESVLCYWFVWSILDEDAVLREFWVVFSPLLGVLLGLFLVPPIFTNHLAGEKALQLKMGLLLSASIPYDWIKEVKETSVHRGGIRVGIGVRYFPISGLMFVTSGFSSVAVLKLDKQHEVGRLWKREVEEIVMSVSNLPRFMQIMRARLGAEEGG
jgi:hypothetical protein